VLPGAELPSGGGELTSPFGRGDSAGMGDGTGTEKNGSCISAASLVLSEEDGDGRCDCARADFGSAGMDFGAAGGSWVEVSGDVSAATGGRSSGVELAGRAGVLAGVTAGGRVTVGSGCDASGVLGSGEAGEGGAGVVAAWRTPGVCDRDAALRVEGGTTAAGCRGEFGASDSFSWPNSVANAESRFEADAEAAGVAGVPGTLASVSMRLAAGAITRICKAGNAPIAKPQ
jgi:hypothetical protein